MNVRLRSLCKATAALAVIAVFGCAQSQTGAADAKAPPQKSHQAAAYVAPPKHPPAHVQTADYLWTPQERATSPQRYAPYLTWAYPLYSQFGSVHRSGIKVVLYINPLMPEPGESHEFPAITGKYQNLQAKACGGDTVRTYSGTSYLLDVRNPQARQYVREVVNGYVDMLRRQNPGPDPIDLVFVDNANSFYGVEPMPCNFDQAQWTAGVQNALAGAPYPVVMNTLSVRPKIVPAKIEALNGSNIVGLMYEACFTDTQWSAEEIAQILALKKLRRLHKPAGAGFWCYVNGKMTAADAADVTAQRLFEYASFLLTYDPAYSVYQTAYRSPPSTFKVLPETQFVPVDPVTPVDDIDDLKTSGGVYAQQYRYCYYNAKPLGPCEVAVNPNLGSGEVPQSRAYRHSARLTGNGVLDGGRMTFDGPPVDDLPGGGAAILVR